MENFITSNNGNVKAEVLEDEIPNTIISKFEEVMDDDFNTSAALANLHTVFKYVNNIMKNSKKSNKQIVANTLAKILDDIKSVYKILGIFEQKPNEFLFNMKEKYLEKLNIDANKVEKQIDQRAEAKKNKDFETADAIRSNLEKDGIILNDTREGTIWDFKALYNFN